MWPLRVNTTRLVLSVLAICGSGGNHGLTLPTGQGLLGCESWQAWQFACGSQLSANLTLLQLTVTEWKANTSLMAWSVTLS